MKKKRWKSFLLMLMTVLLIGSIFPVSASAASKKPTPGKVTLTKISAPAYNKITINWKKTSNATEYRVYYKKAGTSKWTKIASVKPSKTSYTHKSSKQYPIVVGQKYSYTVRAYNSKSKKMGSYNKKGLTVNTVPATVKLRSVKLDAYSDSGAVCVTWDDAAGCNSYRIYRKTTSNPKWKNIATVKTSEFTDDTPFYWDEGAVKGETNTYTVRAYYSKTKTLGGYNKKGLSIKVPGSSKPNPVVKVKDIALHTHNYSQGTVLDVNNGPITLGVTVSPANATDKSLRWTSSNPSVATVSNNGVITPVSSGEAMIEITSNDGGAWNYYNVTVVDRYLLAKQVVELTNQERAKVGRAPLKLLPALQEAAMVRAKELDTLFDHTRPNGESNATAVSEAGVGWSTDCSENIAAGSDTAARVVQRWMNSPGHKASMLRSTAEYMGVGFYVNEKGETYWVQLFTGGNPDEKTTLTCNLVGGTINGASTYSVTVPCCAKVFMKDLPVPVKPGYTFAGWYSSTDYDRWTKPLNSTIVNINQTVYAKWD